MVYFREGGRVGENKAREIARTVKCIKLCERKTKRRRRKRMVM